MTASLLAELVPPFAPMQCSGRRGLSVAAVTKRERDVLDLLAEGLSTREVAQRLSYSQRTIKNVLQELTTRLNVRNRTQAVALAVRNGWI